MLDPKRVRSGLFLLYWVLLILYLATWGHLALQQPASFDDGVFYSEAFFLNAGLRLFGGVVDNKPPLLVYVISLLFRLDPSIPLVRLVSLGLFAAVLFGAYFLVARLSARKDLALCAVTFVASNWTLRHYGFVELSQSFWQTALAFFAFLLAYSALRRTGGFEHRLRLCCALFFFAGCVWAGALFTKQQAAVALVPICVLVLTYPGRGKSISARVAVFAAFLLGTVTSATVLYLLMLGSSSLAEAYKYIVQSNLSRNAVVRYDTDWWFLKLHTVWSATKSSLRIPAAIAVLLMGQWFVRYWRHRIHGSVNSPDVPAGRGTADPGVPRKEPVLPVATAMIAWSGAVLVFYCMNKLAQAHYLIEVILVACCLLPLALRYLRAVSAVQVLTANLLIVACLTAWHGFITDPVHPGLRGAVGIERQVAQIIEENSAESDEVMLFTDPVYYFLARRLPACRFPYYVDVWTTPLLMDEYKRAVAESFSARRPKVVVFDDGYAERMPEEIVRLVVENTRTGYRKLRFECSNPFSDWKSIYVAEGP